MNKYQLWVKQFQHPYAVHNVIEISRSALLNNFDIFAKFGNVMPVLKSNAYGHGLEVVASILRERSFPYIAVDGYFEAMKIRAVSKQPVLIMGAIAPENFKQIKYRDFSFVVQDKTSVAALGETRKNIKIHLDIDTGMHRYGIDPEELADILELIKTYPNLELEGVASHFADADNTDNTYTERQVSVFDECVKKIKAAGFSPTLIHIANSAGSTKAKSKYANAVRPGFGFYGYSPLTNNDAQAKTLSELKPALTFKSTITKVRQLKKGDKVSYNGIFTAPKDMKIGIITVGYHEGLPRELSNKGILTIGTDPVPIVGRICMNHTMIDLDKTNAKEGDIVTVINSDLSAPNSVNRLAKDFGIFDYGVITKLSSDTRRVMSD